MEFLGDAALGFVAGAYLYHCMQDKDEGHLTAMRSRITSGKALAEIATGLSLGEFVQIGKGEERSGGRDRSSNLADALESVIGAAYLDTGIKAVEKIFNKIFVPYLDECGDDLWADNPKGKLQETAQTIFRKSPVYRVLKQSGPSHSRVYTVEVVVNGKTMGMGEGRNKRMAESRAAEKALRQFTDQARERARGEDRGRRGGARRRRSTPRGD
jgi:ribonuclease-3